MSSDTRALPDQQEPGRGEAVDSRSVGTDRDEPRPARALWLPLALVAVTAILRLWALDHPERIYFDERYYANDANEYVTRGVEEEFAVHPPVGKWLIAGGIALFGFDPFGWRLAAALAGSLTVLAVYLAGLRLFRRRGIAGLAAFLLAVDGLAYTMSRIAMLDIFLALFVVVAFWLLLCDRDRQWSGPPVEPGARDKLPARPHGYRWLAGVSLGLAVATKWSALLAIGAAGLFVLGSELVWRRRLTGRALADGWRPAVSATLTLVAVPVVVYVVSYAGWFANYPQTRLGQDRCEDRQPCSVALGTIVSDWWSEQGEILRFHRNLEAEHPYRATAATWPTMYRPVAYYYESCRPDRDDEDGPCVVEPGNVEAILGVGNPAVWWPALLAYPLLALAAIRWGDWRAWALLAFLLGQYIPWLVLSRPLFFFYTTPIVPFICLAVAWVAWRAAPHRFGRWLAVAIAVTAAGAFVFFYPIWAGAEISEGAWRLRMLLPSWI